MRNLVRETVGLLGALRMRDPSTSDHCQRTRGLSLELGRACGLTEHELSILSLAAELHDIGKIGVPDSILLKPGRLDEQETRLMQDHSRKGYDILCAIPNEKVIEVASVVLSHHEAHDGSGYPDGLRGEAIPPLARIVAVVDAYDAIGSVRPYHRAHTHAQIMNILLEQQPFKYDSHVLGKFEKVIARSSFRAADD